MFSMIACPNTGTDFNQGLKVNGDGNKSPFFPDTVLKLNNLKL